MKFSLPTSEAHTLPSKTDGLFNYVPLHVLLS